MTGTAYTIITVMANNNATTGSGLMSWIKWIVVAIIAVATVIPGIIKMANNSGDRDDAEFNRGLRQLIIGIILGVAVVPIFSYVEGKMNDAANTTINAKSYMQIADEAAETQPIEVNGETYTIE